MKVSLNWLKDFVDVPTDPRELKRTLTNLGLGVESISPWDGDSILEVEVTTNRPDCLSHYGIAREIATAYRVPLRKAEVALKEYGPPATEEISIEIQNPDLCARYCARVIRNIQVKPSPCWLVSRLAAVGARSINNVADATNYVLMEAGHPLHAFDLAQVRARQVLVRRAQTGESLKTLDGVERKLTQENLVIADAERPIALAGIMGGEDSGITDATRSVLLESAWFDPLSVRRTAKAQRMHTEASHRFERGADVEMAPSALDRATALVAELAGGEILRGKMDVYPRPLRREPIDLQRSEIHRILGAEILWEEVERILRSLGFFLERRGTEGWRIVPPSFRLDVVREADLIEEVARHFGYDRLPSRLVPAPPGAERDLQREKELAMAQRLVSLGYREIKTSSMVDPVENARFSEEASVTIQNPLSQEASALRASAIPSMLAALRWNLDRGQEDLRFFETGKIYWSSNEGPQERRVLALGLTGHRRPATVHDNARELGFFDLKGDVEATLDLFAIPELRFKEPEPDQEPTLLRFLDKSSPYRLLAQFVSAGSVLASMGRIGKEQPTAHQQALSVPKLRRDVWVAEIKLDLLLGFALKSKSFHAFSKFPAVPRDFSLLIPDGVTYARVEEAILKLALNEIAAVKPLELIPAQFIYKPTAQMAANSLLLRITFQSQEHTLTGEEISVASRKIVDALEPLGIHLRGQGSEGK